MQIFQWMHLAKLYMTENYKNINIALVLLMEKNRLHLYFPQ